MDEESYYENITKAIKFLNNYREALSFWFGLFDLEIVYFRERIARVNNSISFYIYPEDAEKHHRKHFHVFINSKKVASVYLDNLEIDYMDSKVKKSDKKLIQKWISDNSEKLSTMEHYGEIGFTIPCFAQPRG